MRKRILVVDDDERVLFVLRDILTRLGSEYEILAARNGHEALDKAREVPFDLIITDLRMPGMDGVELTEAIRALNLQTVVVWMTAYGCHQVNAEAVRLAVYRCLDKPLEVTKIRQIAREALEAAGRQTPDVIDGWKVHTGIRRCNRIGCGWHAILRLSEGRRNVC